MRTLAAAMVLVLVAAACSGGSDSAESHEPAPTTTAIPTTTPAPTTTVAPTTTPAPTTTVAPTTTPAPTTTLVPVTTTTAYIDPEVGLIGFPVPCRLLQNWSSEMLSANCFDWPAAVSIIESTPLEGAVAGAVVMVERAGWRGPNVLVPESWVLKIRDGGGSGGSGTWRNPVDPRERVSSSAGISRGGWYEIDGVEGSVTPMVPAEWIVDEINPRTFLYEAVVDGFTITGVWEAHESLCCYSDAQIALSKPDNAVASAFLDFLVEPHEEISTEGPRETSRNRLGFPVTVNGATVDLMRQTIASAGSTAVNYTMNYPFVQLHLNQSWNDEASNRQIEQTVNTWIRDHVNTQIAEFLENTTPRYQENILPLTSQPNYNIEVNTTVQLLSDSYLSIHESWSGEATGTTLCPCPEFSYTFDLSDGTLLELRDLFVKESDWTQQIAAEVRRASPIEYGFVLDESELTAEKIVNAAFTLAPTGLYLYLPATRKNGE